jgi:hypothetical protein
MTDTTTRVLRLRYRATCAVCASELAAGTQAEWDKVRKVATCVPCTTTRPAVGEAGPTDQPSLIAQATAVEATAAVEPSVTDERPGSVAGGSARAEAKRRREKQQARLQAEREARPIVGRLRQALAPEADVGTVWDKGAVGEEKLAEAMQPLVEAGTIMALHDRRIPRSTANIDHLAVAANGVWVIDAKRYAGRIAKDVRGGFFSSREILSVGGRDRTKLTEGVDKQINVVRTALEAAGLADIPVHGALCFIDGDWSLLRRRPFSIEGVLVTWGKALRERLAEPGELDGEQRQRIVDVLADALRPAS